MLHVYSTPTQHCISVVRFAAVLPFHPIVLSCGCQDQEKEEVLIENTYQPGIPSQHNFSEV